MAKQAKVKQMVGMDIGSSMIKMVYVVDGKAQKCISEFIPENITIDKARYMSDEMVDFIRNITKENSIPPCDVAMILPAGQVYIRSITLPAMNKEQLSYNIPFEFSDYLEGDYKNYYFDYALEKMLYNEENQPVEMNLFTCAASREVIEGYRAMLKRAGFTLKSVIPEEYALKLALKNVIKEEIKQVEKEASEDAGLDETTETPSEPMLPQKQVSCVVDLGYRTTELFFYEDTSYKLKRSVDFGMYDLEKIVCDLYMVDSATARRYVSENRDNILESEKCRETYSAFAVEVMKAVNYFNYNNRDASVNTFYMCGGGSFLKYFGEAVQIATNLEIHSAADLVPVEASLEAPWIYMQVYNCAMQE